MEIQRISTGGIGWLEELEGSTGWLWGSDYTSGDLYEAEELYRSGHRINKNRLIFVKAGDGAVCEPLKAADGQYFGRPCFYEGRFIVLLADFPAGELRLMAVQPEGEASESTGGGAPGDAGRADILAVIGLSGIKDCYNLLPQISPLMISRQEAELFQLVWPFKAEFAIAPQESFCFRDGERLFFSKWFEDPDYREEVVVRALDGTVLEQYPGSLRDGPDGQKWLLV
ncbi:MAG: hypothetical protein IJL80_10325 [Treponema sp.]|nr:hypothetical protein [Treponema sp.]